MNYQRLGKSTLEISRIGFGCMSLNPYDQHLQQLIDAAIEKGINYFDTADLYDKGLNEAVLGKALKSKREKVLIATKVGNQWKADGSGWAWNPRKVYMLKAVEDSLQRLKTTYIDLYQLHGGTMGDPMDEVIETFELLQQQGKIRYYGISSIRPNVIREYVKRSAIVSVMMQYSLLDRRPEESCLPLLKENNIGVLVRGAVAGGLLADKPPKTYLNYSENEVDQLTKKIAALSPPRRTVAHTAISFVLQQPAVSGVVVGIRTMQQLEDAVEAETNLPLTGHELNVLRDTVPVNNYAEHR